MKILLPTDRSENAAHAIKYALKLFSGQKVEFTLLQVFDIPTYTADMPMPMDVVGTKEIQRELDEEIKNNLEPNSEQGHTFKSLVEQGSLVSNIEALVDEHGFDLVIMGTKGASGIAAAVVGTNTADVIQAATCPVLAVPESADIEKMPQNILFACDYKGLSDGEVVKPMEEIAKRFKSHIHILNVLDEGKMTTVDEAVAGLKIDHMLESVKHSCHFENSDDKAEAIEEFLNSHDIDLLAVVPRKNNFFDAIFHRSVTRKLTLHTKVPLLAMHDLG